MRFLLATGLLVVSLSACPVFALENEEPQNWYSVAEPDQSDWSANRVAKYTHYKRQQGVVPRAILSIPSLNIEAAVFPDTVHGSLEGGVSWVSGTSEPGSTGNVAIAGHRDSFFRKLEGIQIGTKIHLRMQGLQSVYKVESVSIVDPLDTKPLEPTLADVLTLITCHPFYYQGYAPDRYIVSARLMNNIDSQVELAK